MISDDKTGKTQEAYNNLLDKISKLVEEAETEYKKIKQEG